MVRLTKKQIKELKEKYSTPIGYRNNIPIFKAIEDEDSKLTMKFFCPDCEGWHIHGIDDDIGHRVAHCGFQFNEWGEEIDPPMRRHGYYLILNKKTI